MILPPAQPAAVPGNYDDLRAAYLALYAESEDLYNKRGLLTHSCMACPTCGRMTRPRYLRENGTAKLGCIECLSDDAVNRLSVIAAKNLTIGELERAVREKDDVIGRYQRVCMQAADAAQATERRLENQKASILAYHAEVYKWASKVGTLTGLLREWDDWATVHAFKPSDPQSTWGRTQAVLDR